MVESDENKPEPQRFRSRRSLLTSNVYDKQDKLRDAALFQKCSPQFLNGICDLVYSKIYPPGTDVLGVAAFEHIVLEHRRRQLLPRLCQQPPGPLR